MNKKVLIVDDDEGILDAMSMMLELAGYSVVTTAKGDETAKKAVEHKPDVVILDLLMSGNDGREICKQLKHNAETKKIPVIMTSAHPTAQKGVMEVGADDFLPKPFESQTLLQKIEKYAN